MLDSIYHLSTIQIRVYNDFNTDSIDVDLLLTFVFCFSPR